MNGYQKQSYQTQILAKAFLALMLIYLIFHLFLSDRSIPAYFQTTHHYQTLVAETTSLKSQRDMLYNRVTRLRPETLDIDLIEDYTLRMLGHGVSGSIILVE